MGRPIGATTRPQFYTYTDENDRKEFAAWVKKNYKKDPVLAKWYGDQMYGKAPQPLVGDIDNPIQLQITGMTIVKDGNSLQDKE